MTVHLVSAAMRRTRSLLAALLVLAMVAGTGLFAAPAAEATHRHRDAAWSSAWANPITGKVGGSVPVSADFGALSLGCSNADRSHVYAYYLGTSSYSAHLGVDISHGVGQPIYAVGAGKVLSSGMKWGQSWGDVVLIEHTDAAGGRFTVTYGHVASVVKAGQTVALGQRIGTVVTAGTGAHLHLGLRPGSSTTEQPTIRDARVSGNHCSLVGNTLGMVDAVTYLAARKPAVTAATATVSYAGKMVRRPDGAVFLVKADNKRYHVPTGGDFQALRNNGVAKVELSTAQVNAIPNSGQQARVRRHDDPVIHGPSRWITSYTNTSHGYAGDYKTTTSAAGRSYVTNEAVWTLTQAPGIHRIKVFVPTRHAVAGVVYDIYDGTKLVKSVAVNQRQVYGWHILDTRRFNSSTVTIRLRDNKGTGPYNAVIGFDATELIPLR